LLSRKEVFPNRHDGKESKGYYDIEPNSIQRSSTPIAKYQNPSKDYRTYCRVENDFFPVALHTDIDLSKTK
ncbi:MAG: hypothetical protein IKH11_00735, partial [Bacteroidales bacterium]|nr:hypothetical protein [Bacteroidales bacterium]